MKLQKVDWRVVGFAISCQLILLLGIAFLFFVAGGLALFFVNFLGVIHEQDSIEGIDSLIRNFKIAVTIYWCFSFYFFFAKNIHFDWAMAIENLPYMVRIVPVVFLFCYPIVSITQYVITAVVPEDFERCATVVSVVKKEGGKVATEFVENVEQKIPDSLKKYTDGFKPLFICIEKGYKNLDDIVSHEVVFKSIEQLSKNRAKNKSETKRLIENSYFREIKQVTPYFKARLHEKYLELNTYKGYKKKRALKALHTAITSEIREYRVAIAVEYALLDAIKQNHALNKEELATIFVKNFIDSRKWKETASSDEIIAAIVKSDGDILNFYKEVDRLNICLLYTSPSPRDLSTSRMPSSA